VTTWSDVEDGAVVLHKDAVFVVSRSGLVVSLTHLPEPCPRCPHVGRPAPDRAVRVLQVGHPRYVAPKPAQGRSVVVFDVETGDAEGMFRPNLGFVRLAGYAGNDDRVWTTTEVPTLLEALDGADEVVGHNVCGFDLLALCHQHGLDWETVAAKSRDTLILARLADPPRARDTGGSVDRYDLDAVAAKLGVPGKSGDLRALKREFGGYDKIPTDDPRYVSYLTADVEASRAVAAHLPMTRYGRREHHLASLAGRMTLNGFRVDVPLLQQRIVEGEETKERALLELHDRFGLPLSRTVMRGRGKARHEEEEAFSSPLATTEGGAWWSAQVERFHWRRAPRTPKGKLSTGASDLAPVLTRKSCPPELAEIVRLMATVTQVRTVYQTVADNLVVDRVHSLINMGQASGRWSVTRPGLTVFGKRGGRHIEREIFLPEPGHVLLSCDLSQVDMRGIAGHCQDPAYMELFEPGKDVHTEIAIQIFGDASHRQDAKAIGHGANYGLGAKKMIANGHDPEKVYAFFDGMAKNFPRLIEWRDELRERAARGELLDNGFGRLMRCDPERAYTQAPALMGQGSARDLLCDALLRLPEHFRPWLRAMIHDEVLISCPEQDADRLGTELREAFTTTWRGVPVTCDLSTPGKNWGDVSAK
jgi:DNA polymerase-1